MIIIDEEPLSLRKKPEAGSLEEKLQKQVMEGLQRVRTRKKPIKIKRNYKIRKDSNGIMILPSPVATPMSQMVLGDDGMKHKWKYSKEGVKKDRITDAYIPDKLRVLTEIIVDPRNDPEQAYFLTEVMDLQALGLHLEDREKEAMQRLEKEEEELDVQFMIKNKRSPLTDNDIIVLAMAYGVGEEDDPIPVLKEELWLKVKSLHEADSDTYQKFLSDADSMGKEVKVNAYVNKAEKAGLIQVKGLSWVYADSGHTICAIPGSRIQKAKLALAEYLLKNEGEYNSFVASLEGEVNSLANALNDLEALPVPSLKKKVKELTNSELIFDKNATKEEILKEYDKWSKK
jgi:hypothetical protein